MIFRSESNFEPVALALLVADWRWFLHDPWTSAGGRITRPQRPRSEKASVAVGSSARSSFGARGGESPWEASARYLNARTSFYFPAGFYNSYSLSCIYHTYIYIYIHIHCIYITIRYTDRLLTERLARRYLAASAPYNPLRRYYKTPGERDQWSTTGRPCCSLDYPLPALCGRCEQPMKKNNNNRTVWTV